MLRNKELRRFAAWFGGVSAAAVTAGFWVNALCGWVTLAACAGFAALFYSFTKARYQSLKRLAARMDQALHDDRRLFIAAEEEGELSILESEIGKMTARLREQNRALQADKELLAQSLADIAHQLRTPLTSAGLILSLAQTEPDEAKRRALLRENRELLSQMEWLVNALLKLSRLDAGAVAFQSEAFTARALIDVAVRPLAIPMELHAITLQISAPGEIVLHGDLEWLAQALQNILKNCMESAGDGGTLQIVCEENPLFRGIAIHDSGPGFAREALPRLFDRFYRGGGASSAGYGVGLALAKSVILRQGGTIVAKNHPQGGALFEIRFPK